MHEAAAGVRAPVNPPGIDLRGFIGTWHLLPALCRYAFGKPPASGRYVIEWLADGALSLTSEWMGAYGHRHGLHFIGPVDGRPHPLSGSRIADAIRLDYASPRRLDSTAFRHGYEVMRAERSLIEADRLRIAVHGRRADGEPYTNVDEYRRDPRAAAGIIRG